MEKRINKSPAFLRGIKPRRENHLNTHSSPNLAAGYSGKVWDKDKIKEHPCFSEEAHFKFARIHLPVARLCNIGCKYCIRAINKVENRPGVASAILSPCEAFNKLKKVVKNYPLTVAGIAGPGEPLANKETFETFKLVDKEFPELMKCLSTNGLLLLDYIDTLKKLNLATLTVTVNAFTPKAAQQIYDFVILQGRTYRGVEAAKILLQRQIKGIKEAVKAGIYTKVNTVLIPRINRGEIVKIAKLYGCLGVKIMNIIPLIPIYRMSSQRAPTCKELRKVRDKSEKYIQQFRHCKQCRADALGIPALPRKDFSSSTEYFHF